MDSVIEQLYVDALKPELKAKAIAELSKRLFSASVARQFPFETTTYSLASPLRERKGAAASLKQLLEDILNPNLRENSLAALVKMGDTLQQSLGLLLWEAPCVMAAILQDIIATYPFLSPPRLTEREASRVSNGIALLRWVGTHPECRSQFLEARILDYLYPFLNVTDTTKQNEYLRLTSLGVIGSISKVDDDKAIHYYMETEIFPKCLRSLDVGGELSKVVACFIIRAILSDDVGIQYVCATAERFFSLCNVLKSAVIWTENHHSSRLLKHIVGCFVRLYDHKRGYDLLPNYLPMQLMNGTFNELFYQDTDSRTSLEKVLLSIKQRYRL